MPRMKTTDKIQALRQKQAEIQAQLQAAEARAKEQARKDETRRKVIAGALALEHAEKNGNSDFARILRGLLNEYVIRPIDRRLFPDLPELEKPTTPPQAPPQANAAEICTMPGEGEAP